MSVLRHFPCKLLALCAAILLLPAGGALASQVFPEHVGDAPGGAPDVASVTVAHKLAGSLTFGVSFANRTTLSGEDFVLISLNSDQDKATGEDGEDFWLGVWGDAPDTATLFVDTRLVILPSGTVDWLYVPVANLAVSWTGQTMSLTFDRKDVGAEKGLDFLILSHTGGDVTSANAEVAPHFGTWSYSFETVISRITLPKPVVKVKAGTVFSVRGANVALNTDEVFTPDTLTATAKAGGRTLKPLGGGLAWKVPKAAKGKTLVVTLTAAYQGMQKTQSFTLKITK